MPVRSVRRFALCALLFAGAAAARVDIEVRGLDRAERENVEARLSIRALAGAAEDEALVRRLHRQAERDVREALQAYGYYSPEIRAELSGPGPDPDKPRWRALYDIAPGPVTRIARVDIRVEGAGLEALRQAAEAFPLRAGDRLLHARYEQGKAALARSAYNSGFLDAVYTRRELRVDPALREAEIALTLQTGPRFHFGAVRVEQDILDPALVARYVPLKEGAPFNPDRLLKAQFALSDLDYFGTVEVDARRANAEGDRIPVTIRTTPRPPQKYAVGLGYGTDTGARLSLGAELRRLNDSGHKLRADLRLSEIKNSLGAEYRVPLGSKPREALLFNGAATFERLGDVESRKYQLGAALQRTPGDWQRRLYLNYEHEETVSDAAGTEQTDLLIPGLSLSRGESNDAIHARSGWYLFADVHGAHRTLLSENNFLQTRLVLRGALPFLERGRLLGRFESGASFVDEFGELPASQRFFAGGDQSVRGYDYNSLGPRNAQGEVIGGKYLLAVGVEAEYLLWRKWGVALFYDAGNAYDDPDTELFRGVGAGIRRRAPIGTVQLDFAHPLDDPERDWRVHLGVRVGL